ncbi:hypothetical protein Fmac_033033 [Flemingia macrophylla]|uniref:Uncharacterized protein n=1 Tax=Flemingia macrophylla TaxID=520843 RepID=A0ABD1L6L1_9FABA
MPSSVTTKGIDNIRPLCGVREMILTVLCYTQNLQLLKDLHFATAATKIKVTLDAEYIIASDIYPQQVKVYEVRN